MSKKILFSEDAREKIKIGIDIVVKAVAGTLGPKGANVFIDNEMMPRITNDGKTIALSITLEDKFENLGAWIVKNAASQTDEVAGDGTSTTSVLLKAIIDEAQKRPESPMQVKRSLIEAGKIVAEMIKKDSKQIKDKQITAVATISSESETIGNLIGEVIDRVGRKTPIMIEDNILPEISYSVVEGLEIKAGAMLVNESEVTMENATVFVTDKKINSLGDIMKLMEILEKKAVTSPVFILPDLDEVVFKLFMKGKEKGLFSALIIRAKGTDLLDIASCTGATMISSATGLDFKDIEERHLGFANKIVSTDRKTLIQAPKTEISQKAINVLHGQINKTTNIFERQALQKRADALTGGIAIIKVGAFTDTEREYQKYKIEDAVNATKSALDEGIVDGGGMCLYRISNKLKGKTIGERILRKALKVPLKTIIENCNEDYTDIIKRMPRYKGYDAKNNKYADMLKAGILDPTKVTRSAFINALESAANYITMEVAICENNVRKSYYGLLDNNEEKK